MAVLDLVVAKPMKASFVWKVRGKQMIQVDTWEWSVIDGPSAQVLGHSWHLEDKGTPLSIWPLERA